MSGPDNAEGSEGYWREKVSDCESTLRKMSATVKEEKKKAEEERRRKEEVQQKNEELQKKVDLLMLKEERRKEVEGEEGMEDFDNRERERELRMHGKEYRFQKGRKDKEEGLFCPTLDFPNIERCKKVFSGQRWTTLKGVADHIEMVKNLRI